MSDIKAIQHNLKRDIYNLLSILKFINSDAKITDPELLEMIELNLSRENSIMEAFTKISNHLRGERKNA